MRSTTLESVAQNQSLIVQFRDPLEQFEVFAVTTPELYTLTNLAFLLGLNTLLTGAWFAFFNVNLTTNYDFALTSLYSLVRSIVQENLYIKKQQFFTVIFYLFFTVLTANMFGLLPYSFTITSSFVFTFFLALMHFIGLNHLVSVLHGWEAMKNFLPAGTPLVIAPFLALVEFVSYIARVFSLSIRLFANMMSGHALLKILIGFSWAMITVGYAFPLFAALPWVIVTAIMILEVLIAFLQAYVFAVLVTLYINDALVLHDA